MDERSGIRKILEQLLMNLEKKSKQSLTKEQRNELLDHMVKLVMKPGNHSHLRDKDFLKKLSTVMMIAISLSKPGEMKEFVNKLNNLFKNIDMNKLLKMKGPAFKKFMENILTPNELKKLNEILNDLSKKLLENLRKNFGIITNKADEKAVSDDLYKNLFGLLTSTITGSHAIPIQAYIGNGLGINDWNPNDGYAPIDSVNSIKDTQFGDSYGLNASTLSNYAQLEDNPLAKQEAQSTFNPSPFKTKPTPSGTAE